MLTPKDKNYLAMLAVPVLVSMLLGSSGSMFADDTFFDRDQESRTEETRDEKESAKLRTVGDERQILDTAGEVSDASLSRREQLQNAIDGEDFDAFVKAASDTPFSDIMTEEAFKVLVEQYRLRTLGYRPTDIGTFS